MHGWAEWEGAVPPQLRNSYSDRVIERENVKEEQSKRSREKRKIEKGLKEVLLWDILSHCEMKDLKLINGPDMNVSWKEICVICVVNQLSVFGSCLEHGRSFL